MSTIKLGIISSKGGHLVQLLALDQIFSKYKHFWVTFSGSDTNYLLKRSKKYYAFFPENRNLINLLKNFFLAIKITLKEKPTILISSGAGITVPFFYVGKLIFKTNNIYVESFDHVKYPSLTGKLVYNVTDLFLIQHQLQQKWYPKAKYWGSLL